MNMTSEGMSSSSMAGAMEADMAGLPSRLSVIPWWLSLFAVLFPLQWAWGQVIIRPAKQ